MKLIITILVVIAALQVQAGGTFTLIEINPLHGHSQLTVTSDSAKTYYGAGELSGFTEMGGKFYFSAQSTPGDDELWATDGTVQGTALVKAINPGHGAAIGNLVYVNNHILFMASDNGTSWDLWSTDGTDSGTVKIDRLNASSNTALGVYNASVIGNRLIFCAQKKILITDGTTTGTDSLASIVNYAQGFGYCELNGYVYFVLPELAGGNEIWRTDGTTTGTQAALDFSNTSYRIASANEVLSFNGKIYLSATDSSQSTSLYSFDGTINGQLNRVVSAPAGSAGVHGLNKYNNDLYFIAPDSIYTNLYHIANGTTSPVPLIPGSTFAALSNLSFANNTAFCMESGNKQIHAVELTGFTYSVLNLQGLHLPNYPYRDKEFLTGGNGLIFFEAYDSTSNLQVLMQSDFTNAGTLTVMPSGSNTVHPFNCYLNGSIKDVFDLQMWGNNLIVPANFTDAGRELWIFDPSGINSVAEVNNQETFVVYPNPANKRLTVKVNLCSNCGQVINIFNTTGQLVMQKIAKDETTVIDLTSFGAGAYFISLSENGSVIAAKKLILAK
jgi:ELWxxDGT repeat protein